MTIGPKESKDGRFQIQRIGSGCAASRLAVIEAHLCRGSESSSDA